MSQKIIVTEEQLAIESKKLYNDVVIDDFSMCYNCKSTGLKEEDLFCPNCRFPQRGSQIEMKRFLIGVKRKKRMLLEQRKAVGKARTILYILAAINLLFGLVFGVFRENDPAILIGSLIGAGIYFALALWSTKKPFAAILSGFIIYIVFITIAAIQDPNTIYQGLLWKILILSGFYYGYKGAKDSENLEMELSDLQNAKDLS